MIHKAGAGHPGGSLSAIDLLVALYGTQMKVDPSNPESPTRDRFIMSKGHASPAVYAILKELGFLTIRFRWFQEFRISMPRACRYEMD